MASRDKEHIGVKHLKSALADGKIDRRQFLRDSTLLGLSAAAAYAFVGKVTGEQMVPRARAATPPRGARSASVQLYSRSRSHIPTNGPSPTSQSISMSI